MSMSNIFKNPQTNWKYILIVLVLAVLVAGGVLWCFYNKSEVEVNNFDECIMAGYPALESWPRQCRTSDGRNFVEYIGNELEKLDIIQIDSPRPNQEITSPFVVEGKALGNWYFEADFPIELFDENGNSLGNAIAKAQGEWMTQDFVNFRAELEFEDPIIDKGILVLSKDNPSGLPEYDDQLIVPVRFAR